MKINKIAVSLIAAGVMASPLAHATNGDSMMSVGSQNTALGGTGVANFVGADSTFANPAMLAKSKGREATGGVVLFKPKVANDGMGGTAATSTADTNYIPDISYSSRMDENLTWGIAMAGIAGMGVDYTGAPAGTHVLAKTALSILKVVPTIAYNKDNYGVGFSPVLQYGSLMITYNNGAAYNAAQKADTNTGYGYSLGGYYNAMPALTVAAAYSSEIKMKYGTQLSGAGTGFNLVGGAGFENFADTLTQPSEIKAGVAYNIANNFTVTADYKSIQWASATGYKDFGWKNQTILAVGGKYAAEGYWLGVGYNNADDPIGELPTTTYHNSVTNFFNNMMFPAIVKSAYTFGGGYSMSKALDVEASVMIAPEVKKTVLVGNGLPPSNTTTHSQQSYSVSLRYKY